MRHKVLLVDDEPNIVMSLEYAFKKNNFEVFVARDGEEALNILKNEVPNVILLDIMMPNVDGYQTLQEIKKNKALKETKVIFVSAKNKASDIDKGLTLGADHYITKPFSVKNIISKVKELLG